MIFFILLVITYILLTTAVNLPTELFVYLVILTMGFCPSMTNCGERIQRQVPSGAGRNHDEEKNSSTAHQREHDHR